MKSRRPRSVKTPLTRIQKIGPYTAVGGVGYLAGAAQEWSWVFGIFAVGTLFVGVVLPGIWSRYPARRQAALLMVQELRQWVRPTKGERG